MDFLHEVIGNPDYYKPCKAIFECGAEVTSEKGMDALLELPEGSHSP
jgi:peptide/nickel transport system substrate-binding protein